MKSCCSRGVLLRLSPFKSDSLRYFRGHLAFFRNSPDVLNRFLKYHKFASVPNFLHDGQTPVDAEESSFSHFLFSEDTSFTFVTFEAMVNSWDTVLLSSAGVFYSTMQKDAVTPDVRKTLLPLIRSIGATRLPTFSEDGVEQEAIVYTDGQYYNGGLWFDKKYVTYVVTGWTRPEDREQKQYIMRREPHKPITQRLEPRGPHLYRDGDIQVDECLYKHWQVEKHERK